MVHKLCTASVRYHTVCTASAVDGVASSGCAWPACQKNKSDAPSLGEGVVNTIYTTSYCGCSSCTTSCMLYIFGPDMSSNT